jgi:AmmeMemoRadiSam system protein B
MSFVSLSSLTLTAFFVVPCSLLAQAMNTPGRAAPPSLEEVRTTMGIPSQGDVRGQQDAVGFASTAEQMARVWELSASPPRPEQLGPAPEGDVAAVICPHDDYLYAGRVYREVLPLIKAKTVVLVGVFHRYRRFGAHNVVVFDTYRAWRSPDGDVPVSPLREELIAGMPADEVTSSAAMHDSEHSLEALVYWLRHIRPDVEIVPIIVPESAFPRLEVIAGHLAAALGRAMVKHGWKLGSDVAIAISSDAVHYGPDFKYTPYGEGGVEAYEAAYAHDVKLIRGPLSGTLTNDRVRALYADFVDPRHPDSYRLTWCGRFAIPFGLLVLRATAADLRLPAPVGHPLAYATSVGWPELPVRGTGMGATAPANLYHFVGYPAVAYTLGK